MTMTRMRTKTGTTARMTPQSTSREAARPRRIRTLTAMTRTGTATDACGRQASPDAGAACMSWRRKARRRIQRTGALTAAIATMPTGFETRLALPGANKRRTDLQNPPPLSRHPSQRPLAQIAGRPRRRRSPLRRAEPAVPRAAGARGRPAPTVRRRPAATALARRHRVPAVAVRKMRPQALALSALTSRLARQTPLHLRLHRTAGVVTKGTALCRSAIASGGSGGRRSDRAAPHGTGTPRRLQKLQMPRNFPSSSQLQMMSVWPRHRRPNWPRLPWQMTPRPAVEWQVRMPPLTCCPRHQQAQGRRPRGGRCL
jgi:hypothetical protein